MIHPFLRFAGGKRWLAPVVDPLVSKNSLVVDPFVGSGGLILPALEPKQPPLDSEKVLIIGDESPFIATMWQAMRENPYKLAASSVEQLARAGHRDGYYEVRRELNDAIRSRHSGRRDIQSDGSGWRHSGRRDSQSDTARLNDTASSATSEADVTIAIAARFIAINRTCFKGLLRVNNHGEINVPYGHLADPKLDVDALVTFGLAVQRSNVSIIEGGWESTLNAAIVYNRPGLIVIDPPYAGSTHTSFCAKQWTALDRIRLSTLVRSFVEDRGWTAAICDDASTGAQDAWRWAGWSFMRRPRRMSDAQGRGGGGGDEIFAIVTSASDVTLPQC